MTNKSKNRVEAPHVPLFLDGSFHVPPVIHHTAQGDPLPGPALTPHRAPTVLPRPRPPSQPRSCIATPAAGSTPCSCPCSVACTHTEAHSEPYQYHSLHHPTQPNPCPPLPSPLSSMLPDATSHATFISLARSTQLNSTQLNSTCRRAGLPPSSLTVSMKSFGALVVLALALNGGAAVKPKSDDEIVAYSFAEYVGDATHPDPSSAAAAAAANTTTTALLLACLTTRIAIATPLCNRPHHPCRHTHTHCQVRGRLPEGLRRRLHRVEDP